jgi:glycosyltransferase involved in cell wall biosynthesis
VYNEAGNILPQIKQIHQALAGFDYELIYVNDGSTDGTLTELRDIDDNSLSIIDLQRNYGQSLALMAGIDAARGLFVVTMDGDLQNDPGDIPDLLHRAEQGDYDLVAGVRTKRQDNALLRTLPSWLAATLISRTTGLDWKDYGCALKVIRTRLARKLGLYGELHRFVALLAHLDGARMLQVPVRHHPRQIGRSKYGLSRTLKVLSDLLLLLFLKKYFLKPMHLFGGIGILSLFIGSSISVVWLFQRLTNYAGNENSFLLLVGLVLIVAGLQFIGFGIMSELQMRTYFESQSRKPYLIRATYSREDRLIKKTINSAGLASGL